MTDEKLEPRTVIGLEILYYRNPKPIRLKAEIVWSHLIEPLDEVACYEVGAKTFTENELEKARFLKYLRYP